jgi:predicted nucleic-acid-binding protein
LIGLDTNILLRLVLQDDRVQSLRVVQFMDDLDTDGPAYINCISLMEFAWFLRRRLKIARTEVAAAIGDLLESQDLLIEDEPLVEEALWLMLDQSVEFADAFIALRNRSAGCSKTMTFDNQAAARVPGMELLA